MRIATGEVEDTRRDNESPAAQLGRRGGLKGGKARAAKMTPEERSAAAKRAVEGRWKKSRNNP
jgi:hypothetical protein